MSASLKIDISGKLGATDFDVQIESSSSRLALFGPTGAGKTTILKSIGGFLPRLKGKIDFENMRWDDENAHVAPHQRGAVIIYQDSRLFPHLSVRKNIEYGHTDGEGPSITDVVELSSVADLLDRSVHTLSGGEQKRVAIARAIVAAPKLLLLDEPYAGLDRASALQLRQDLRTLLAELDLPHILVSHHLDDVLFHADEVVLIEKGRSVQAGTPQEVFSSPDGQRLVGEADEFVAAGPLTILRASRVKKSSIKGLAAWELENGRHLLLGGTAQSGDAYIRIRGADVSIALEMPADTSILNVLPATICAIDASQGFVDVRLDLGRELFLTARITAYSAEKLKLEPGLVVHAMIKAAALTN